MEPLTKRKRIKALSDDDKRQKVIYLFIKFADYCKPLLPTGTPEPENFPVSDWKQKVLTHNT